MICPQCKSSENTYSPDSDNLEITCLDCGCVFDLDEAQEQAMYQVDYQDLNVKAARAAGATHQSSFNHDIFYRKTSHEVLQAQVYQTSEGPKLSDWRYYGSYEPPSAVRL